MEACSGQNHDNKTAPQVNFTPTAASIMDLLCIFVITRQYFFSMLVIIFSNMSYLTWYTGTYQPNYKLEDTTVQPKAAVCVQCVIPTVHVGYFRLE